jgi:hypothetical protein
MPGLSARSFFTLKNIIMKVYKDHQLLRACPHINAQEIINQRTYFKETGWTNIKIDPAGRAELIRQALKCIFPDQQEALRCAKKAEERRTQHWAFDPGYTMNV